MTTAKAGVRRRFSHIVFMLALLYQCVFCCGTTRAEMSGLNFSVDRIQAAGVPDRAFAEAIFDSVSARIEDGSYRVSTEDSTEKILLEYGVSTENAVIAASGRRIRDISGIELLRNAFSIDLSENEITDLGSLALNPDIEAHRNYFAAREIVLSGNPIARIPENLIGFVNGTYRMDTVLTLPLLLRYRSDESTEKQVVLHSREQGGERKKAVVFRSQSELELSESVEHAFQHSMTAAVNYRSSATQGERLVLRWSIPFDLRYVREFRDEVKLKCSGNIELLAETAEGMPLQGVGYRLLRESDSSEGVLFSDTVYHTDEAGMLAITDLPSGNYCLEQTDGPEGYHTLQERLRFVIADATAIEEQLRAALRETGLPQEITLTEDVRNVYFSAHGSVGVDFGPGELRERNVASSGADGFLTNRESLRCLKGEILEREGFRLMPESRIRIYEDEHLIESFEHPAPARQALNRYLQEGRLRENSGSICVKEELFCLGQTQALRAVFVKSPGSEVRRVVVKKSWDSASTEREAYFRPLMLQDGKVLAVLGEVKPVRAENGWEAAWDFAASSSNAGRNHFGSRRASASDAEEEAMFRKDGVLFLHTLPNGCEIGIEEINIPEGYAPQYEGVRCEGDSATFYVRNRAFASQSLESVMLMRSAVLPAATAQGYPAQRVRAERPGRVRENTAPVLHSEVTEPEVKRSQDTAEEVGTEGVRQEKDKQGSVFKREPARETRRKKQSKAPLPWAKLENCIVRRGNTGRLRLRGRSLHRKYGKGLRGQKLPQTGEKQQGVYAESTRLMWLLLLLGAGSRMAKLCFRANRRDDRC